MTATSTSCIWPLVGCGWTKVVSSGNNRWRKVDESVSLLTGWQSAADDEALPMAAICRASASERRNQSNGRDARGHRALSARGGDGAERRGRRAVEALRRRHGARSAPAQG